MATYQQHFTGAPTYDYRWVLGILLLRRNGDSTVLEIAQSSYVQPVP